MTNYTIFAVDDSATILNYISDVLSHQYKLILARNGTEFIEKINTARPDLILLDIMMPDINGYELCGALKKEEKYRDIPVIFLTSQNDQDSIIKGFESGAVDYIIKPFHEHELIARINTHLELMHSRELLRKKNTELIEANASKDTFFSLIAHDLRGPLSALIGISKLLVDDYASIDPEQIKKFLGIIHESTHSTLNLLENLLQWARAQTGSIAYEPQPLDMHALISMTFDLYNKSAADKSITLCSLVEKGTMVFADLNMIQTVLRNLVSNSLKFTPEGGRIEVRSSRQNDHIQISVSDNGLGIKKTNQEKIFHIDKHFSTPGTNNEKGTGLGLILCENFIHLNKGEIQLVSQEEKGCTVYFSLPIAPA